MESCCIIITVIFLNFLVSYTPYFVVGCSVIPTEFFCLNPVSGSAKQLFLKQVHSLALFGSALVL